MTEDEDWRRQIKEMFDRVAETPRDVVRGVGITADDLIRWNEMVGTQVDVTWPGKLVEDVDGSPLLVEASSTHKEFFGSPLIARAELEATGLTEEDVPNITIRDIGGNHA